MSAASGAKLDAALTDLGWRDMLDEMPDTAIPLVFRLLGETGAHAPVLNDVVLRAAGRGSCGSAPTGPTQRWTGCPYILCQKVIRCRSLRAGGHWVGG